MTTETLPAAAPAAPPAIEPGYCSEHPEERLVGHRRAGDRYWYGADVPNVCPHADHRADRRSRRDRERCLWCGIAVFRPDEPEWRTNGRRAYCTANHRLLAFRAKRRQAVARAHA